MIQFNDGVNYKLVKIDKKYAAPGAKDSETIWGKIQENWNFKPPANKHEFEEIHMVQNFDLW